MMSKIKFNITKFILETWVQNLSLKYKNNFYYIFYYILLLLHRIILKNY